MNFDKLYCFFDFDGKIARKKRDFNNVYPLFKNIRKLFIDCLEQWENNKCPISVYVIEHIYNRANKLIEYYLSSFNGQHVTNEYNMLKSLSSEIDIAYDAAKRRYNPENTVIDELTKIIIDNHFKPGIYESATGEIRLSDIKNMITEFGSFNKLINELPKIKNIKNRYTKKYIQIQAKNAHFLFYIKNVNYGFYGIELDGYGIQYEPVGEKVNKKFIKTINYNFRHFSDDGRLVNDTIYELYKEKRDVPIKCDIIDKEFFDNEIEFKFNEFKEFMY